jgi:uncharacterized damage-inducible protein DinB
MPTEATKDTLIAGLLAAWRANDRVNQYLIDHLTDEAWTAKPSGGKGRTIAAIFAHMHNVRLMWVKAAGKGIDLPDSAEKTDFGRAAAKKALAGSARAIGELLERTLPAGRVSGFPPGAAAFFGYIVAHDSHHRGQIVMIARQVGHPVPVEAGYGLWEWNKRLQETDQA